MAKRRNNKRQQQPVDDDQLVDIVEVKDQVEDIFEKNKTMILGGLAALVLIVGAYLLYKYMYKMPREQQAYEQIFKAEQQFAQDSFALALENPGGGYEGFLGIMDSYGGTKAANISKYYAGISYLNLGRFDEAIEYLKSYSPSDEFTPIMKNGAMGDAYSELGDEGQAESYYAKAANADDNDFLTPYYLYKLGLLQKKNGKNDAALKSFKRIQDDYSTSNEGLNVTRHIVSLEN